jgi:NitT/TauT family transport system substrate-binding protein
MTVKPLMGIWKIMMKRFKFKRASQLALVLTSMAMLASCGSAPTSTAPEAATEPTTAAATPADQQELKDVRVQLSFLKQSLDAPLIIAINKGYFAEEGLNVAYERGFGNSDTIGKLGTGKFDFAFSDMYNTMDFNEKNPNDQIIAVAITQNRAPFSVISLKESGISKPEDLAGKKMGAPTGDGPRNLFPLFAEQVGIDPNSVEWTAMEPKLREAFLLQGQVDAITGFSTSALPSLLKAGKTMDDINVFYYSDNGLNFYGNAILAKSAFVKENPDVVKAFVRAYFRGFQDMLKDPSAALDAVIASDDSKLMDREAEKVRLEIALQEIFVTPEVEKDGLGGLNDERMTKTIEQAVQGFDLTSTPALGDIYSGEFLPPAEELTLPPASDRKPLM